jgi:hypothetical protein
MTTNNPNNTNRAKKLTGPDVLYPELSYRVMEAVFEVYNRLGPGFSEEIYQIMFLFVSFVHSWYS